VAETYFVRWLFCWLVIYIWGCLRRLRSEDCTSTVGKIDDDDDDDDVD
jgi:hypothetical protein